MKQRNESARGPLARSSRNLGVTLLVAALLVSGSATAASNKGFLGGVTEVGPGRAEPVSDFLFDLTEELEARITICAVFESTRPRSRGTFEGLIWVLRPNQTGEQCEFSGQPVVRGQALVCCQTGSPEDYPAGTVVAGELRKLGVARMRDQDTTTAHVEVFDGGVEVEKTLAGRAAKRWPGLSSALAEPIPARPIESHELPE